MVEAEGEAWAKDVLNDMAFELISYLGTVQHVRDVRVRAKPPASAQLITNWERVRGNAQIQESVSCDCDEWWLACFNGMGIWRFSRAISRKGYRTNCVTSTSASTGSNCRGTWASTIVYPPLEQSRSILSRS
jgi:hypothetical protein